MVVVAGAEEAGEDEVAGEEELVVVAGKEEEDRAEVHLAAPAPAPDELRRARAVRRGELLHDSSAGGVGRRLDMADGGRGDVRSPSPGGSGRRCPPPTDEPPLPALLPASSSRSPARSSGWRWTGGALSFLARLDGGSSGRERAGEGHELPQSHLAGRRALPRARELLRHRLGSSAARGRGWRGRGNPPPLELTPEQGGSPPDPARRCISLAPAGHLLDSAAARLAPAGRAERARPTAAAAARGRGGPRRPLPLVTRRGLTSTRRLGPAAASAPTACSAPRRTGVGEGRPAPLQLAARPTAKREARPSCAAAGGAQAERERGSRGGEGVVAGGGREG
ncbi:unnamed protein product [Urochloa humidicola]